LRFAYTNQVFEKRRKMDNLDEYKDLLPPEDNPDDHHENGNGGKKVTGGYTGIHTAGFKDFLLKNELNRAIVDCGFEHPSEVQ